MEQVLALLTGTIFAAGIYMMLRRSIVKVIMGLALVSHAVNLLIFTVAGVTRGKPPLIGEGQSVLAPSVADPLPQALILTAIVIGFGVQAFSLILFKRAYQAVGSDDMDEMRSTDT